MDIGMTDKATIVKNMAMKGEFSDIEKKYGISASEKARAWAAKRIASLVALKEAGEDLGSNHNASDFLLFAAECSSKNLSIDDLSTLFRDRDETTNWPTDSLSAVSDGSTQYSKLVCTGSPMPTKRKSGSQSESAAEPSNKRPDNKPLISGKQRQKKAPNAPKGPKNAYVFFAMATRPEMIRDNPFLSIGEHGKRMGRIWKELPSAARKTYEDLAEQDKHRYMLEMKAFLELHPDYKVRMTRAKSLTFSGRNEKVRNNLRKRGKQKKNARPQVGTVAATAEDLSGCFAAEEKELYSSDGEPVTEFNTSSSSKSRRRHSSPKIKGYTPYVTMEKEGRLKKHTVELDTQCPHGIKQADIPPELDLKRMKEVPREKGVFPTDEGVRKEGQHVALILAPYREFISRLPLSFQSHHSLEGVQQVCETLTSDVVFGTVTGSSSVSLGFGQNVSVVTMMVTGELGHEGQGEVGATAIESISGDTILQFDIAYVPMTSPLLVSDRFLIPRVQFVSSLGCRWMVVNAQVNRIFATSAGESAVYEGSIYYVRKNWQQDPYNSVKVVWLAQEADTLAWVYDYVQTDNECSPWDLSLSPYGLPENLHPSTLPVDLLENKPTPAAVLSYIAGLDFAYVFKYQVSDIEEYCALFPDINDQLDLVKLNSHCQAGRFKDAKGRPFSGLLLLFSELEAMVRNCKEFNAENRDFQVWRCADMMEAELFDLQEELACLHNIECLQVAVDLYRKNIMQSESRQEAEM